MQNVADSISNIQNRVTDATGIPAEVTPPGAPVADKMSTLQQSQANAAAHIATLMNVQNGLNMSARDLVYASSMQGTNCLATLLNIQNRMTDQIGVPAETAIPGPPNERKGSTAQQGQASTTAKGKYCAHGKLKFHCNICTPVPSCATFRELQRSYLHRAPPLPLTLEL